VKHLSVHTVAYRTPFKSQEIFSDVFGIASRPSTGVRSTVEVGLFKSGDIQALDKVFVVHAFVGQVNQKQTPAATTLWLKKNAPTSADYNYDPVQSILIIFSKLFVNDHKSCLVVKFSTAPHICCHCTL